MLWFTTNSNTIVIQKLVDPTPCPRIEWVHSDLGVDKTIWYLWDFSSTVGWRACCNVSDEDVPRVVAELEHFDFRVLKAHSWREGMGDFLAWLYKLVRSFIIQKFQWLTAKYIG